MGFGRDDWAATLDDHEAIKDSSSMKDHREKSRKKRLPEGYSGVRHLGWLFSGCGLVVSICLLFIQNMQWWEGATFPVFYVFFNAYEYLSHRWPAHHPWRSPLMFFFKSHVGVHHKFFTFQHMYPTDGEKDLYFVLFPLTYYALWLLVVTVPTFLFGHLLLTWNSQLLFVCAGSLYLMNYELFHSFSHNALPRPVQHCLEHLPGLGAIRRNHRLHHHPRLMNSSNFNITYPVFDWLLGTLVSNVKE